MINVTLSKKTLQRYRKSCKTAEHRKTFKRYLQLYRDRLSERREYYKRKVLSEFITLIGVGLFIAIIIFFSIAKALVLFLDPN